MTRCSTLPSSLSATRPVSRPGPLTSRAFPKRDQNSQLLIVPQRTAINMHYICRFPTLCLEDQPVKPVAKQRFPHMVESRMPRVVAKRGIRTRLALCAQIVGNTERFSRLAALEGATLVTKRGTRARWRVRCRACRPLRWPLFLNDTHGMVLSVRKQLRVSLANGAPPMFRGRYALGHVRILGSLAKGLGDRSVHVLGRARYRVIFKVGAAGVERSGRPESIVPRETENPSVAGGVCFRLLGNALSLDAKGGRLRPPARYGGARDNRSMFQARCQMPSRKTTKLRK